MEHNTPHYPIERIKRLIRDGSYRITRSARISADQDFGLRTDADVVGHVLTLTRKEFYKTMTTMYDHTLWQDVYYSEIDGEPAYVKVQIEAGDVGVVISLKKRD